MGPARRCRGQACRVDTSASLTRSRSSLATSSDQEIEDNQLVADATHKRPLAKTSRNQAAPRVVSSRRSSASVLRSLSISPEGAIMRRLILRVSRHVRRRPGLAAIPSRR